MISFTEAYFFHQQADIKKKKDSGEKLAMDEKLFQGIAPYLRHWLYGNRMARDMFCSLLIMMLVIPCVILNGINIHSWCCPQFDLHMLFVYRSVDTMEEKTANENDERTWWPFENKTDKP